MSKRLTHEEFMRFSYLFDENIEVISEYKTAKGNIRCKCKRCGNIWTTMPDTLKRGGGCPKCAPLKISKKLSKTHDEFEHEMLEINSNIKLKGRYNGANNKIDCLCLKHDYPFSSKASHLLDGHTGCKKCESEIISAKKTIDNDSFVKELQKISPSIIPLEEYTGGKKRICVRCYVCGFSWYPVAGSLLQGFGCPFCNRPQSEKSMDEIFRKYGIAFVPQKVFEDLKGKRGIRLSYDFYIPEFNLLIEMQGPYHDDSINKKRAKEWFSRRKTLDGVKMLYAKRNGYNFLEIWYYEMDRAEKILLNKISNLKDPVTITVT